MNSPLTQKILEAIQYATIATASANGTPWNTPVFYAFDEHGNIYWASHPEAVHSQNITATGKAFICIYNSKASEGEGLGLYIEAAASLANTTEIEDALALLGTRRGHPFLHPEKFMDGAQQRIYKAVPLNAWTNNALKDDGGDFIKDFRVKVEL